MNNANEIGASFAMNVNVTIQIRDGMDRIVKTVNKHNRATQLMLGGMLGFLKGEFNTSYRQDNIDAIRKLNSAKNYIPCFVGAGTYGIEINTDTGLPNYNENNRRSAPTTQALADEIVQFSDTRLKTEIPIRHGVDILSGNDAEPYIYTGVGDCVQCVLWADVPPNYFNAVAYGASTDIFITELGLFSTPTPNDTNLLARVVLKDNDILYVRPQDTIMLRWTICLISLNDLSQSRNPVDNTYSDVDMDISNNLTIINEEDNGNE